MPSSSAPPASTWGLEWVCVGDLVCITGRASQQWEELLVVRDRLWLRKWPKHRSGAGQLERRERTTPLFDRHFKLIMNLIWTPGLSPKTLLCSSQHQGIKGRDRKVLTQCAPQSPPFTYIPRIPWIQTLPSRTTIITWIQDILLRIFLNPFQQLCQGILYM